MSKLFHDTAAAAVFSDKKLNKVNLFESARMFCDLYCLEPGQQQAEHTHAGSDKVYHGLTGTCQVRIGDESHTLGPGLLAVAPSGLPHSLKNDSGQRATVLVMMAPHPSFKG